MGAGSKACEEEGRDDDAAFLSVVTSIRATADVTLLPPKDPLELYERSNLVEVLAKNGKFVEESLARDPLRFAALMDRVRDADLSIPANYDPGWIIGDGEKRTLYAEVIDGLRADKLAMESYVAMLVRDEVYFAAYLERVAMLADLPDDGGQLPERFDEVAKIMQARIDVLGDPPTEIAVPWRKVYKPGPNAPFTVLHRGFNGPVKSEALLFRSSAEVRQSWVGNALSQDELSQVLSQINFENELLGLYAVGEMPNATENFFVTEFGPQKDFDNHSIAVRVGVVGEHCGFEPSRSYPFVLVKASSQTVGGLDSLSRANYPDQCVSVMAGKPTLVVDSD
ncbi:hypothetical protein QWY75_06215 [Pontixanthobacter aestiaquae]|uniref:Uncharacterized protein n=1 Tax=Pontixanthobacter aestiaquae TaxID=1509367 RepID=A0A844Z3E0_9SPHN|nr:hypothetical protein [Pontixanthobacter aestiaquae]MDN3645795.1 hypothetical protein [Pontixanthobacter aestiaquae]MXO83211.1 hypothetical protein [Pontixanthobacter aestiaquae]